jgi:hypothetical protein
LVFDIGCSLSNIPLSMANIILVFAPSQQFAAM